MAKNEADIMEGMIRHNLGSLDALHVVDNDSADATPAILTALAEEFPGRVTWAADPRHGHRQTEIINETLPGLAEATGAFQIVLLDADECLCGEREQVLATLRSVDTPILLPWVTYVPTETDDRTVLNPIARITHRRVREAPQYFKTTVPAALIGRVQVSAGSHKLKGDIPEGVTHATNASLAHFPVRSREQLVSKVLIGAWNLRLRSYRKPREGNHWLMLAERILSGEPVSEADLQAVALGYAAKSPVPLMNDPLPVETRDLKYTPTSDGGALWTNLAAFAERCVRMLEMRETADQPSSSASI